MASMNMQVPPVKLCRMVKEYGSNWYDNKFVKLCIVVGVVMKFSKSSVSDVQIIFECG